MPTNPTRDEAVDFFDRLYGMTFRLFLDPNSEAEDGNTVKLRLGATVDNLALLETEDHAILYSAATVDALRGEVQRLREAMDKVVNAFERLGEAKGVVSNLEARRDCENALIQLKDALKDPTP